MIKLLCTHTIGVYFLWEGAAATYLKSLCDASTRAKKGKQEAHRNLCRKQGRTGEVGCHNVIYIDIPPGGSIKIRSPNLTANTNLES